MLALFALAFFEPTDIVAFVTIGMIMSVLVSTQDIATDSYAVRQMAVRDRPLGNALQGGAVALGVVVGGTLSLVIYHHFGWRPMIWTMCAASLLPLIAALSMREDADPKPADPATRFAARRSGRGPRRARRCSSRWSIAPARG